MEETLIRLARAIDQKRYGKYRGFVTNNSDPEKRGRIKLHIPGVMEDQETDWALPCLPFGGLAEQGFVTIPEIDAQVWVEFEEGDPQRPIWSGTFWQDDVNVPTEAAKDEPTTRLLKTPSGHMLQFDDEDSKEKIHIHHKSNSNITFDEKGSLAISDSSEAIVSLDAENNEITIKDANGNTLKMTSSGINMEDANGNKLEMGASGITLEAQNIILKGSVKLGGEAGEAVIKADTFLNAYAAHTHPTSAGPSGPPVMTAEMSSKAVKVVAT